MSLDTFNLVLLQLLLKSKRIRLLALARYEYRLIRLLVVHAPLLDADLHRPDTSLRHLVKLHVTCGMA